MSVPLGTFVGNALEVMEAVKYLRNEMNSVVIDIVKLIGGLILESKSIYNIFTC